MQEAGVAYKQDRWNIYANYTWVDATFLDFGHVSSIGVAIPIHVLKRADG